MIEVSVGDRSRVAAPGEPFTMIEGTRHGDQGKACLMVFASAVRLHTSTNGFRQSPRNAYKSDIPKSFFVGKTHALT